MNIAVAALLLAGVAYVHALPGGPPLGACANIFPVGHTNPPNAVNNPTDNENNPYQLNLDAFLNASDPQRTTLLYSPGEVYELTVTAPQGGAPYRGVMVQARTTVDGSPVGSFSSFTALTRASLCTPPESAVTHNSRADKTSEVLTWTAPSAGTGNVQFLYAVVIEYVPEPRPGSANMFYGTLTTGVVREIVDECATGADTCDDDATCTDTAEGFECTCNPGFTGNGMTCNGGTSIAGQGLSFWTLMVGAVVVAMSLLL